MKSPFSGGAVLACIWILLAIHLLPRTVLTARAQEIAVENLDGVPYPDRLAFSRIGSFTSPPPNGVHERATLRIHNTGAAVLAISGMTLSGPDRTNWMIESAPPLPANVPAGGFIDVVVRFRASTGGGNHRTHHAILEIVSNDADESLLVVELGGWWQSVSEGGKEPSLSQIVDAFGYDVVIAGNGQTLSNAGTVQAVGDEILSPYWRRADVTKPVNVHQIAAFHTYPDEARIMWHFKGSTTVTAIVTHYSQDAQSFLPRRNNLASLATRGFTPSTTTAGGLFGFRVGPEWSDPLLNDGQIDLANGCDGATAADCGHHVRFWIAKDRQGNVIPNTYLLFMDYSGINYDYNDNGYIISNIVPENGGDVAPRAPTNLVASNQSFSIALDWSDNSDTDLAGYHIYRSTAEAGPYVRANDDVVLTSSFNDASVPAGILHYYRVTSVDAGGSESPWSGPATATRTATASGFTTLNWSQVAPQPFVVSEAHGVVVNNKFYTFGGFDSQKACCTPTNRAYVYDPTQNTWVSIRSLPHTNGGGLTHGGFTTDGTNIYMAGGYISNAGNTGQVFGTNEVYHYNVAADTYTRLPNLPAARAAGRLEYLNGKLHYFGGTNIARTVDVGDHYVLNVSAGATSWTTAAPLPNPRHHMGSAVVGGRIYAIGGQHGHDDALVTQASLHAYDPATNRWQALENLPLARSHHAAVVNGGRIIILGGERSHGNSLSRVDAYDPVANTWIALTSLPANRVSGVAGSIGGDLFYSAGNTAAQTYKGVSSSGSPPEAIFSASPISGQAPLTVSFDASASRDPDGSIVSYAWNFGDGATGSGARVSHTYAAGAYSAVLTVTDSNGKTDTASENISVLGAGVSAVGEAGCVSTVQSGPTQWHTLALSNTYVDPVVVMQGLSYNNREPATVRVRNVATSRFEFQLDEWDYLDGAHAEETMCYVVFESGVHRLEDGRRVQAGHTPISSTPKTVGFSQGFSALPIVVSQVVTTNDPRAVVTRQQGITTSGFTAFLQGQESDPSHLVEKVAWIAAEVGTGTTGGRRYESGRTPDDVSQNWYTVSFTTPFSSAPAFVPAMQSVDGIDVASLRFRGLSSSGVEVVVDEEQSTDTERNHTTETVGYLAFEKGSIVATSSGGTPPVASFTANPNRGPAPLEVTFDASASSDNDGAIATYVWDFGDGNTGSGVTTSHSYSGDGSYTATLTVTDDTGKSGSATATILAEASTTLKQPQITGTSIADRAVGVSRDSFIAADVSLPNEGQGIDVSTLNSSTVRLFVSGTPGATVQANLNTSGGGDAIVLQPTSLLAANTPYTFEISSGLKDLAGASFVAFRMSFTTGSLPTGGGSSDIEFEKVALAGAGGKHTSLAIGPDGKLYATTHNGSIKRWTILADGTLANVQTIGSLRSAEGGDRLPVGLAFDPSSTADNLIVWITHTNFGFSGMGDWGGKLTRLSGPDLLTVQDYIINLPRSIRDHVTNSVAFGPDGALYFLQGSNTAMGDADNAWGNRPERKLSAAVIRVDVPALEASGAIPLDVKTAEGGSFDPYAPGSPVKLFATGIRNAYDLVWHSNGYLYVPTNGSAAGGNAPASVAGTIRPDGSPYSGPAVPAIDSVETQDDFLFRIPPPNSSGSWTYRYYGHPNPARGEYAMNGGNPTASPDLAQVDRYPVGVKPDTRWQGHAYNFGRNISPNGVIEYKSRVFGGSLRGKLLVVRYSGGDDIIVLSPDPTTGDIMPDGDELGIQGFTVFADPLDLVENTTNGHLYVSSFGGSGAITLLRPLNTTVSEQAFAESSGLVVMEAEHYDENVGRNGHVWLEQTPTGSVGSSMWASPNNGGNNNTGYSSLSPEMQYFVNFSTPGTYFVWARIWGDTPDDDSFHAGLNGNEIPTADKITASKRSVWQWTKTTMDGSLPATINVTAAGSYVFNVWMREDGLHIDRLLLTTDSAYQPSGTGPAESSRVSASNIVPTAAFTATPPSGEAPLHVSFDARSSSDGDGTIVSYAWDFDDGTTDNASGALVSHTYNTMGTYEARLVVTDDKGATSAVSHSISVAAAGSTHLIGEAGSVTVEQLAPDQWHSVTLSKPYVKPVVLMPALSYQGSEPTVVRVRNVTSSGFEFQIDEWDYLDGVHAAETAHYVVFEAGRHVLDSGAIVEAGTTSASSSGALVTFSESFSRAPMVLSQVTTVNDPSSVVTRHEGVLPTQFTVRLQGQQLAPSHATETVAWAALSTGVHNSDGKTYQVSVTPDAVKHQWYGIVFAGSFDVAPVFLAAMQRIDGQETAAIRYRSLTANGVEIFVEEEQSSDDEKHHTTEPVGYLAFEEGSIRTGDTNAAAKMGAMATISDAVIEEAPPTSYALKGNYPNPFNPTTTVRYELPEEVEVNLEVFDVMGRRISVLVQETQRPGRYEASFNADGLPSGVYFYRLQAGSFMQIGRMVLVK